MAVLTIIPQSFTWNDLRDTLNAHGGRVTNDGASAFDERSNVNIWSGRKATWNENYPSSFNIDRVSNNIHYLKYKQAVPPYRPKDYVGYNAAALPCKLNRISISPNTVTISGQDMTIFFEWFTGEIDWRVFGATILRFYLIVDGIMVTSQKKEVLLNDVSFNSIISNSGSEVFKYTFVGNPGKSKQIGVAVSMVDSNGQIYIINESSAIIEITEKVEYKVNYPTNIIYSYNGKWNTYASYIQTKPVMPIDTSSGILYDSLQIPFNTTNQSILQNFKSSVFFRLPGGTTTTFLYDSETPDQAATKVLMYKLLGSGINWNPITDPYYVTILG